MEQKLKIAVFIDFDNIEIGVKSTLHREFDVAAVLDALKERGEIVTKFAYANWGRQESATRALSEHAVQMVQRDPSPRGGPQREIGRIYAVIGAGGPRDLSVKHGKTARP